MAASHGEDHAVDANMFEERSNTMVARRPAVEVWSYAYSRKNAGAGGARQAVEYRNRQTWLLARFVIDGREQAGRVTTAASASEYAANIRELVSAQSRQEGECRAVHPPPHL